MLLLFAGFGYAQSHESAVKNQTLAARYSMAMLEAHQANSLEKINDFYHYLNLLSAAKDKELQAQLKENIYALFEDKNIIVNDILAQKAGQIPLSYLLDNIASRGISFSVIDERAGKDFYRDSWYDYYTLQIAEKGKATTLQVKQSVYMKPEKKAFGETYKTVLSVSLGAIE